jgi:hypothetical protein
MARVRSRYGGMADATPREIQEMMMRPAFVLCVRAEPGIDAIRALRAWLKRGLRDFGLRCLAIHEEEGGELEMTSIMERYPKTNLTAKDVEDGDLILRIHYVAWDEMVGGKPRDVVYFANDDRRLVLNSTNAHRIARLYGDDGDKWPACWIKLYHDPDVEFDGKKQPGIRVHEQKPEPPKGDNGPLPEIPSRRRASLRDEMEDEIPF